MTNSRYAKPEQLFLKHHPELNERWVQARLAEDPSLLGLGDLILKDKERTHPYGGRLDLLFQDAESNHRYEVEVQLGRTDESHIIRAIEYWDIERRRYPQYDHTAVIVAEDVTARFLNVISLFNGFIPLVAIQMRAYKLGDQVFLVFTTVLDEIELGLVDEDEEVQTVADRPYWERRGSKATVEMVEKLLALIREHDSDITLKYNKFYIGLARDGVPANYVTFRPKKEFLRLEVRLSRSNETQTRLEEEGVDTMEYDSRHRQYRIRLTKGDLAKHEQLLRDLFFQAYQEASG